MPPSHHAIRRPRRDKTVTKTCLIVTFVAIIVVVGSWGWKRRQEQTYARTINSHQHHPTTTTTTEEEEDKAITFSPLFRDGSNFHLTSAAHCTFDLMNKDTIKTQTCYFKDLCFNPITRRFVYYRGESPEFRQHARMPTNVSVGWDMAFEYDVVDQDIPKSALVPRIRGAPSLQGTTWVLHASNRDVTSWILENFIRDEIFAWWFAVAHAPWTSSHMEPLSLFSMPMSSTFHAWMRVFLPHLQSGPTLLEDLSKAAPITSSTPVCFPRAVVGTQIMTDHCLVQSHDWQPPKPQGPNYRFEDKLGVKTVPCAAGRGPLFWRLRVEALLHVPHTSTGEDIVFVALPHLPKGSTGQAFLASHGYEFDKVLTCMETLGTRLMESSSSIPVKVIVRNPGEMTVPEQLEFVQRVFVYVTLPFGESSVPAQFLRRGSAVVFVCDSKKKRTNFGFWNNLAYVRAKWIDDDVPPSVGDSGKMVKFIADEVETSKVFVV